MCLVYTVASVLEYGLVSYLRSREAMQKEDFHVLKTSCKVLAEEQPLTAVAVAQESAIPPIGKLDTIAPSPAGVGYLNDGKIKSFFKSFCEGKDTDRLFEEKSLCQMPIEGVQFRR